MKLIRQLHLLAMAALPRIPQSQMQSTKRLLVGYFRRNQVVLRVERLILELQHSLPDWNANRDRNFCQDLRLGRKIVAEQAEMGLAMAEHNIGHAKRRRRRNCWIPATC